MNAIVICFPGVPTFVLLEPAGAEGLHPVASDRAIVPTIKRTRVRKLVFTLPSCPQAARNASNSSPRLPTYQFSKSGLGWDLANRAARRSITLGDVEIAAAGFQHSRAPTNRTANTIR